MGEHAKHDHLQNGLIVATALELTRHNANRSSSLWARVGEYLLTLVAATAASSLFDHLFNRPKAPHHEPAHHGGDSPALPANDDQEVEAKRKAWAKSVKRDPSCGCSLRS